MKRMIKKHLRFVLIVFALIVAVGLFTLGYGHLEHIFVFIVEGVWSGVWKKVEEVSL